MFLIVYVDKHDELIYRAFEYKQDAIEASKDMPADVLLIEGKLHKVYRNE